MNIPTNLIFDTVILHCSILLLPHMRTQGVRQLNFVHLSVSVSTKLPDLDT